MTGLTLAVGAVLWWRNTIHPAKMPLTKPWDFSLYPGNILPPLWYLRGLTLTPSIERPHKLRRTPLLSGVALIWVTPQTHFVYLSQHMFFLNGCSTWACT